MNQNTTTQTDQEVEKFFSHELRRLLAYVIILIVIGTTFYRFFENWSWVDSYYFSVMTLTTVGYGDITPVTDIGKIFTTLYVLGGLGVVFAFLQALATRQTKRSFFRRIFTGREE